MQCTRLVAYGYSQVARVNFSKNDLLVNFGMTGKVDDKTSFLYGELKETIYLECPPVVKDEDKEVILQKHSEGLVQAARQYNKKAVAILKKIGFTRGNVYPCLHMEQNSEGRICMKLYADDNLMVGNPEAMDEAVELL